MPLIDLAKINYIGVNGGSDFYIGSIVNSSSGPSEIKIISNEIDLDTYYPDLEYREAYLKLVSSGANLVLKRINNYNTRLATLRLTSNPNLRYVYPLIYDSIEYEPIAETDFVSGIIIDLISPNNTLDPNDLYPGNKFNVTGIIYGSYNPGDLIKLKVNNVTYSSHLDSEGKFLFEVDGLDLKEDEYTKLDIYLYTLNGINLEEVHSYLDYSIVGNKNISVALDQIGLVDYLDIPPGTTNYQVRGVLNGDYSDQDLVEVILNGVTYSTNCDSKGEFFIDLPILEFLSNNFLEVIATTNTIYAPYKAYNFIRYKTSYLDLDLSSLEEHRSAYKELQTLNTKTLVYTIDFGTSRMLPEDYLIIPRSNPANWNSNVMIYFVSSDSDTMTPDDFVNPVPINSVSSPQWRVVIPDDEAEYELLRSNRAKYVYELFTGESTGMDSGVIPNLCKLDEVNNKVTLVFSTPISDIKYYQSNDSSSPFLVTSDQEYTNKLLVQFSRNESVLSFTTLIEGSLEVKIKLTYIDGYKFYLEETYKEDSNTYLVSLYESDKDYNGENIFIEDILNLQSRYLRTFSHISEKIESYIFDGVGFSPNDAKQLEGTYLVSKGLEGENSLENLDTYESSLSELFTSGMDLNIFVTDVFNEKEYLEKLYPYLVNYQVMGITNIPDSIFNKEVTSEVLVSPHSFESSLDSFLLPDSQREYLIYCFGEALLDDKFYIPSSYYQARELISGSFIGSIPDNILYSSLTKSEMDIMDSRYINYLEETDSNYNITYVSNLPIYLEPIYLLTSIYTKQYLTRYLRSRIGEYGLDIYFVLKQELINIRSYTSLISALRIDKFYIKGNNLDVIFMLELTGLVGKTLSINISLNTN